MGFGKGRQELELAGCIPRVLSDSLIMAISGRATGVSADDQ